MMVPLNESTRWGVRAPVGTHEVVVDNFGYLTLDGAHPDGRAWDRYPSWAAPNDVVDEPPTVVRLPDHATGYNYMVPTPLPPIHILPPTDDVEPRVRHVNLHPYRFGRIVLLAAFAVEINQWAIGRLAD